MDDPRILLLNPRYPNYQSGLMKRPSRIWQPICLASIASILEKRGLDLMLLDANALGLTAGHIEEVASSYEPGIIVVNSAQHDRWQNPIPTLDHLRSLLDALSAASPKAAIILIGPHGTELPEHTLRELPRIDVIVRGEPEFLTVELITALVHGKPVDGISGLSFMRVGSCVHTPDRAFLDDLDALPLPAYHLLPMDRYRFRGDATDPANDKERFAITVTSRGCPYRCAYCSLTMLGTTYRVRSIDGVLAEVDLLVNRYGVNKMIFHDQVFTLRRERVEELCLGLIERNYQLKWLCQAVTHGFPFELMPLLKKAGCSQISFGLESGVEEISESTKKNRIGDFLRIWEEGKRLGIDIIPNHMVGLPGETPELARRSNQFFKRFGFKYFFASATIPYPGTALYEKGRRNGTIKDDTWESVVNATGVVDNGFDRESIAEIMNELYSEENEQNK